MDGIGPIDPDLAPDLARAAATNPKTTWCVTVTDEQGHAVGHGCARPEPTNHARTTQHPRPGPPGGPGPPGEHDPPGGTPSPRFTFAASGQPGPPGGYGHWRLTTGVPGRPDLMVTLDPLALDTCDHPYQARRPDPGVKLRPLPPHLMPPLAPIALDTCAHRYQARGHDPGVKLRHLSQIRHATCTGPTCRRPSTQADFEHNIPFENGGRTCLCNGGPLCKR